MSKYTEHLKEITDIDEYFDVASEVLFQLSEDIRESDKYDTDIREEDPPYWDYVIRGKAVDLYEGVKDEIYEMASEKFPEEKYIDIVEPITYE